MTITPRQLIDQLIAFPTVSRDSNMALIDFVREYLDDLGVESRIVPNEDGSKANLYATVGPMVEGGVVLSGHTDVVPVDGQPWDSDPFRVVERDGRLFGRGTADMKSFYAIGLALVPEMLERGMRRPVHFALSYDEEVGCLGAPDMIKRMAEQLPPPRAVIVGEPTSMRVVNAHKGMIGLDTTVLGKEAHSSLTHHGVSAVMTAARMVNFLADLAGEAEQFESEVARHFDPPYTTIHVGRIDGGTARNIISRECRFEWDIRNVPDDDPYAYIERFNRYCEDELLPAMRVVAPGANITTRKVFDSPGLKPEDDGAAEAFVKQLTGQNATMAVSYGTEAGQFQREGFSTVICGPGSIEQAHQPNEYIDLAQVDACEGFLRKVIDAQAV